MQSLFVAALLAGVTPSASPNAPAWQSDYTAARDLASQQQKPLAVFVGSGAEGWINLVRDGSVDSHTLTVLSQDYICVYADRSTAEGSRMASALQVSNPTGLVISDRTGKLQAFSHDGSLTGSELQRTVEKYTDAGRVVSMTESINGSIIVPASYSVVPTVSTTTVPVVLTQTGTVMQTPVLMTAPTISATPVPAPAMAAPVYPTPVHYQPVYAPSSCPNGRCPNSVYVPSSCPNGRCPNR